MQRSVAPLQRPRIRLRLPGDKSIAHRALMLSAVAGASGRLRNLPDGEDVASTASALRGLGVQIESEGDTVRVLGVGMDGLREPRGPLDCGNSGTTMRLLSGLLAGAGVAATLTGDASLRRRPMERVAAPLRSMGAEVETEDKGRPPLRIRGGGLAGVDYAPTVASAQVKSAVLMAGLYAGGPTSVGERCPTRDHTERLLSWMGASLSVVRGDVTVVSIEPCGALQPLDGTIPGDASSAAYWVALAASTPGAEVQLHDVGLNPTRVALFGLLSDWGADIDVEPLRIEMGEPVGTIRATATRRLSGGEVAADVVPSLIDELPLVGALAPLTDEGVLVRGAGELRVKESDRIASICAGLRAMEVDVDELEDGFRVPGGQRPVAGTVDSHGDHRVALAFAVLGAAASGVTLQGAEAASVSYPEFFDLLERLR